MRSYLASKNTMKHFLTLTAAIEAGAGWGLLVVPSDIVQLLLGADISGAAIPLGRVAGAALLALSVACWLTRGDAQNQAARRLIAAMLLYNFAVVVILGAAGARSHATGVALWPAVIIHAVMAVWCLSFLSRKQTQPH